MSEPHPPVEPPPVPPTPHPVADPQAPPPAAPSTLTPVSVNERVAEIDVVRGFALLGILLMNIEYFNRPLQGIQMGLDPTLAGIDRVAGWLVMTLVQGKFYTLFSILFGMGFAIQLDRATARGASFPSFFARRLVVLAAIGAVHGFLLWPGDILLVYALAGFPLLLFFRRMPASRLPKWGVPLVFLPLVGLWLMVGSFEAMRASDPPQYEEMIAEQTQARAQLAEEYAAAVDDWSHDGFVELGARRASDMVDQLRYFPFFGFTLVGLFAIGTWFVRSGTILRPEMHLAFYRRGCALGLGAGLPLAVLAMTSGYTDGFGVMAWSLPISNTMMEVANLALAIGYLCALVMLLQDPRWKQRLRPMAMAGRMALTNYLLQSVICTTLFYGYGFGLFGEVPRAWQILLVFAIYAVNLTLSTIWLRHYRFGPAEWLWRTLTYGKLQPLRR